MKATIYSFLFFRNDNLQDWTIVHLPLNPVEIAAAVVVMMKRTKTMKTIGDDDDNDGEDDDDDDEDDDEEVKPNWQRP